MQSKSTGAVMRFRICLSGCHGDPATWTCSHVVATITTTIITIIVIMANFFRIIEGWRGFWTVTPEDRHGERGRAKIGVRANHRHMLSSSSSRDRTQALGRRGRWIVMM